VGKVAKDCLEEEDEADPLVPRVPDLVAVLGEAEKKKKNQKVHILDLNNNFVAESNRIIRRGGGLI
jgi:hypothetical protein